MKEQYVGSHTFFQGEEMTNGFLWLTSSCIPMWDHYIYMEGGILCFPYEIF